MKRVFLACLLFCLCACTAVRPAGENVDIGGGARLQLLPPAALSRAVLSRDVVSGDVASSDPLIVLEKVRGDFRGQSQTLLLQVSQSPTQLVLTGLSPMMNRLFTVHYDDAGIEVWKSPLFTAPLDARYLLADFQIMHLPVGALRAVLRDAHVEDSERAGHLRVRDIVSSDDQALVHMEATADGRISYCHALRQYCLQIERLPARVVP